MLQGKYLAALGRLARRIGISADSHAKRYPDFESGIALVANLKGVSDRDINEILDEIANMAKEQNVAKVQPKSRSHTAGLV